MMNFSQALYFLKRGERVARSGWNGKDMFLFLVPGSTFKVNRPPLLGIYPEGTEVQYHAHIDMKTAQGYVVPWLASQSDLLSDDWEIVMSEHNLEELEEASKEYFAEEAEIVKQIEDERTEKEKEEEVRAVLQKLADYQTAHETGFTEKFDYDKLEMDGKDFPVDKGRIEAAIIDELEAIRILEEQNKSLPQTIGDIVKQTKDNMK